MFCRRSPLRDRRRAAPSRRIPRFCRRSRPSWRVALFVTAGLWQRDRMEQKQALRAQLDAAVGARAAAAARRARLDSAALRAGHRHRYVRRRRGRSCSTTGCTTASSAITSSRRSTLADGRVVLVNRGWVAGGATRVELPEGPHRRPAMVTRAWARQLRHRRFVELKPRHGRRSRSGRTSTSQRYHAGHRTRRAADRRRADRTGRRRGHAGARLAGARSRRRAAPHLHGAVVHVRRARARACGCIFTFVRSAMTTPQPHAGSAQRTAKRPAHAAAACAGRRRAGHRVVCASTTSSRATST